MRKQLIYAALCAALLPGLSGCAKSASDRIEMAVIGIPLILTATAVAAPVMIVDNAIEKEKSKYRRNHSLPETRKLWSKKGINEDSVAAAAQKCGYLAAYGEPEIKTAADADELAQRAACMEKAGFHYSFSASEANFKKYNIGGAQELSYAGICRNYAQYQLPACQKGANLRSQASYMQRFLSYCANPVNKKAASCSSVSYKKENCAKPENRKKKWCDAAAFKDARESDLRSFNYHCNNKENRSKPECRP